MDVVRAFGATQHGLKKLTETVKSLQTLMEIEEDENKRTIMLHVLQTLKMNISQKETTIAALKTQMCNNLANSI